MYTLDAELTAAMEAGRYSPYFNMRVVDKLTGDVLFEGQPVGYELQGLELTVSVQSAVFLDFPPARAGVVLQRGATLSAVPHTLDSSVYVIISADWDGSFQTFHCHLFPRAYYNGQGDQQYGSVIAIFCQTFGKTAVFKEPAADWLSWQFLPDGKSLTLNNAQAFFTLLKQKYFIFACDNGNDEILFYTPFTQAAAADYTINGYRYDIARSIEMRRQYLWRDENETTHRTTPSFSYVTQPDPLASQVMCLLDLGSGTLLAGTYRGAVGGIYRSTDAGQTWALVYGEATHDGTYALVRTQTGALLAAGTPGGWLARSTDEGLTWAQIAAWGDDTIQCLEVGGPYIFAAHNTAGTVWIKRSADDGLTWPWTWHTHAETAINALEYCGGGVLLAGTSPNGKLYRFADYGDTLHLPVDQLGAESAVLSLTVIENGQAMAGTSPGGKVYLSSDEGLTWGETVSGLGIDLESLISLGYGVILAGSGGSVYRTVDYGFIWTLVSALGAETETRCLLALSNGVALAGTGSNGKLYQCLTAACDLDPVHNLGFMPSTAHEPHAYFQLTPPTFQPIQINLKYQNGDAIEIHLPKINGVSQTYQVNSASVKEILDLSKNSIPWRHILGETEWLANTAGGALPGTIERVAAYTPLVTTNFNQVLDAGDNNLQALADEVDDHTHIIFGATAPTDPVPGKVLHFDTVMGRLYVWDGTTWWTVV